MPLMQTLNKVLTQAESLASVLQKIDSSLDSGNRVGGSAAGTSGGGSMMGGSLANVPGGGTGLVGATFDAARTAFGSVPGVNTALDVAGGAANILSTAMPAMGDQIGREARFYGAAVRMGSNMSIDGMRRASFAFRNTGGMQYAGQDAVIAQQLAQYGVNPAGRFGQQTMTAAGNASAYLNINAETATASLANLSSGAGSANLMRQLGIYTSDPSTGEQLSSTQIMEQIKSRLYTGKAPLTAEAVNASFNRGGLGASLKGLGLDPAMQEMIRASLVADAEGKSMDLTSNSSMRSLAGGQASENPNLAFNRMAEANTQIMDATVGQYTAALNDAATATQMFADVLKFSIKNIPGVSQLVQFGAFDAALNTTPVGAAASQTGQMAAKTAGGIVGGVVDQVFNPVKAVLGALGMGDADSRIAEGSRTAAASSGGQKKPSAWAMPATGAVTSPFGMRKDPKTGADKNHRGTDIAAPEGAPISAIADGIVTEVNSSGYGNGFGKFVRIDHQNGYRSLYAHMSQTLVAKGAKVKRGQLIGKVGSTGYSTGPHLHIEVTKDGAHVDPMSVLTGAEAAAAGATSEANTKGNQIASGMPSTSKISGSGLLPINQDLTALATEQLSTPETFGFRPKNENAGGEMSRVSLGARTGARRSPSTYMPGMPRAKSGDSYVAQDGPVNVHAGEAILNEQDAQAWRDSQRGMGRRSSGANVTISVTVMQASEAEARRLASMVKEYIHEDEVLTRMGSK